MKVYAQLHWKLHSQDCVLFRLTVSQTKLLSCIKVNLNVPLWNSAIRIILIIMRILLLSWKFSFPAWLLHSISQPLFENLLILCTQQVQGPSPSRLLAPQFQITMFYELVLWEPATYLPGHHNALCLYWVFPRTRSNFILCLYREAIPHTVYLNLRS